MTMVRGNDPIWKEVDITGHLFDDTFYLFILSNEIPYTPLPVWHDPFGNVVWDNPIQFLANGTLPNDIYYDPDTVYRLEFRQGPTQSDPLIYLVENYVPGTSGSTPISESSFSTDNQISNPQFALINFTSPLTLTGVSTQIINVAPGWFLHLTGTGTVTLKQVTINSTVSDPTNASYALQIQLSGGWTNAFLSQRFNRNGILWANTFVSSSITALTGNVPQNISANLVDSQGHGLGTVLNTTALTETFNEYTGVTEIPSSINTDFPPTAYIEYQLLLPNNCNITLTSVQLISGDLNITYPYEQTTIERQIDHTYHNAFPIVPVGTVIDFAGYTAPLHYLLCNGSTILRSMYRQLLDVLTMQQSVALNSSNTFSLSAASQVFIGIALEGNGIPPGTVISNISGTTVTISNAATITATSIITFFPWGNGDGSTTFNVPLLGDYVVAGVGGILFGAGNTALGAKGGVADRAITAANMPSQVGVCADNSGTNHVLPNSGTMPNSNYFGSSTATFTAGSDAPFSVIQQTVLMNKYIRFE